ncbi:hypothetical protein V1504DRAFT_396803, partial [Lipomyces starkeyi]
AHIFPLSGDSSSGVDRPWIISRGGEHHSCQNGLLMLFNFHRKLDSYSFSSIQTTLK